MTTGDATSSSSVEGAAAPSHADLVGKARVLHEALPYIQRYAGRIVVVKYGGNAMLDESLKESFIRDVVLLHFVGIRPVVVHGGGPQISQLMERLDHQPQFVRGYRVTGRDELDVVRMVLQKTNKEIVARVNAHGGLAVGISGEDGRLIRARKMTVTGEGGEVDLGFVGDVESVNPHVLVGLLESGFIPIVAPIGVASDGQAFNINADHVAGAVAIALGAEKLVYLTDVAGLYDDVADAGSLLSRITVRDLRRMLEEERLSAGMIPKGTSCIDALDAGVRTAHILDGRLEHAVLLEIFTDSGVGTMVTSR